LEEAELMSKGVRAWTAWALLLVVVLGGAYLIIERADPGLRSQSEGGPAGFGH
jgi:hypothetical protein